MRYCFLFIQIFMNSSSRKFKRAKAAGALTKFKLRSGGDFVDSDDADLSGKNERPVQQRIDYSDPEVWNSRVLPDSKYVHEELLYPGKFYRTGRDLITGESVRAAYVPVRGDGLVRKLIDREWMHKQYPHRYGPHGPLPKTVEEDEAMQRAIDSFQSRRRSGGDYGDVSTVQRRSVNPPGAWPFGGDMKTDREWLAAVERARDDLEYWGDQLDDDRLGWRHYAEQKIAEANEMIRVIKLKLPDLFPDEGSSAQSTGGFILPGELICGNDSRLQNVFGSKEARKRKQSKKA